MPEYRFCHQGTTCGRHKCQDYDSLMLILGLAGCLVIYSANSVFSAITRVNEARLHNSIEVFTTALYKLARIYVTEIYCEGWLSKTSWQNFPVVLVLQLHVALGFSPVSFAREKRIFSCAQQLLYASLRVHQ